MRTVSLTILLLGVVSLSGCCCPPTTRCAPSDDPSGAPRPQVLLETTLLLYGATRPLTEVPMATPTISDPVSGDAAQAILVALEARNDVALLVLPSVVTLADDIATVEVGEMLEDPFIGQRLELAPRLRADEGTIEIRVHATWRDRGGTEGSEGIVRTITETVRLPSGQGAFLVAPGADGKPGYAVLLCATRLEPSAGS